MGASISSNTYPGLGVEAIDKEGGLHEEEVGNRTQETPKETLNHLIARRKKSFRKCETIPSPSSLTLKRVKMSQ